MCALFSIAALAQAPQGISHQAIIRDAGNQLVTDSPIGIKVSIIQTTPDGTVVYSETNTPVSNINGLITFVIGQGTSVDDFSEIDWASGPYFLKTEADPTGGINYTIEGISQVLSVPYALFAGKSGDQTWNKNLNDIYYQNGNVGIGTGSPGAGLHLKGWAFPSSFMFLESGAGQDAGFRIYEGVDAKWHIYNQPFTGGLVIRNAAFHPALFVKQADAYVGIGTTEPTQLLDINGQLRIRGGNPGTGKVLTSDANGTAMWQPAAPAISKLSCIDIDGNAYPTIMIGTQIWMAENLRVTKYRNGNTIPNVTGAATWGALTTGAYCWYGNDATANAKYGALYNWHTVNDPRGLCPEGWRVPTDAEWTTITNWLGGTNVAGGKLKAVSPLWNDWNNPDSDATNLSGFSALPGGYRYTDGTFTWISLKGFWWSSTEYSSTHAWLRHMSDDYGYVYHNNNNKEHGFSVRCLRNID